MRIARLTGQQIVPIEWIGILRFLGGIIGKSGGLGKSSIDEGFGFVTRGQDSVLGGKKGVILHPL